MVATIILFLLDEKQNNALSLTTELLQLYSWTHKQSSSLPLGVSILERGLHSLFHPTEATEGQATWEPFQSDV